MKEALEEIYFMPFPDTSEEDEYAGDLLRMIDKIKEIAREALNR